jgi:hypoxanthine phosphoribosyltransferase
MTSRDAQPASEPGSAPAPARPDGGEVLFTGEQIAETVARMGAEINATYAGQQLTVVTILHGGLIFTADLIRRLELPLHLGVVFASSYRGAETRPGQLTIAVDEALDIAGRHVLLVDDILDTGRTLTRVRDELLARGPASLRTATLLDKPARREVEIAPDFRGFLIEDVFVVGYGLDFDGRWRNLPEILALPEAPAAD